MDRYPRIISGALKNGGRVKRFGIFGRYGTLLIG